MIIGKRFFMNLRFAIFRYLDEGIRARDPSHQKALEICDLMVVLSSNSVNRVPRNGMKRISVRNTVFSLPANIQNKIFESIAKYKGTELKANKLAAQISKQAKR